ncbi:SDR family NAD(P)-dependent oxidoreductase [Henriciella litoralis]|uniref:SDR family NAD(P)-dependent oxidoreductase n=1 Tax=Henriciella litoralis TaxID=568102 RepID=UPI000A00F1D8|nr:SDR family NAD(P)-dependent oxidoreductase [Henriciella litoralis]
MQAAGSRPLITGASRGIGRAFVDAFLEAGAEKIYASVRNDAAAEKLRSVDPRVEPILIDTTDPKTIRAAVSHAPDIDILVNNAGVLYYASFLSSPDLQQARSELEVNYFGTLEMIRAFSPGLIDRGGAIVNILSIAALTYMPLVGTYNASKAAARFMTEGVRHELAPKGVRVLAVYAGGYDTDMHLPETDRALLSPPSLLTGAVLKALADGEDDVFPDPAAQSLRSLLPDSALA